MVSEHHPFGYSFSYSYAYELLLAARYLHGELCASVDAEFGEDVRKMRLHRVGGHEETGRDFSVRETIVNKVSDLSLRRREAVHQ